MLPFAKSKEELLNAPVNIKNAMISHVEWRKALISLHNDINDRFNYPSLWAAIETLLFYQKCATENYIEINRQKRIILSGKTRAIR